jgi:hypothetical protein
MAHEVNITKSYKDKKGKETFYNTPSKDVPDMSLPSEYGKQYDNLEDAVKGAKAISNNSGVVKTGKPNS